VTDSPSYLFRALFTFFWALSLEISSITHLRAVAYWVIVRVSGSRFVIQRYIPKISRIETKLSGLAVSLRAFMVIYSNICFKTSLFLCSSVTML